MITYSGFSRGGDLLSIGALLGFKETLMTGKQCVNPLFREMNIIQFELPQFGRQFSMFENQLDFQKPKYP